MILVALCTWIVFSIRDYCLLRTGRSSEFGRHVRLYAVSVLMAAAGAARLLNTALPPWFLGLAIAWHLLMAALCLWLARRGRYDSIWRVALVPLPAPWIFLARAAARLYPATGGSVVIAAAVAWIVLLGLVARFDRPEAVASDELDFSIRFAAWSNCMAWCLVPLMLQ